MALRPRPVAGPRFASRVPLTPLEEAELQARVDAFFAAQDDEVLAAQLPQELAAAAETAAIRRRFAARLQKRSSLATIGAGLLLFVVASLATPLAGAADHAQPAQAAVPGGAARSGVNALGILSTSTPTPSASSSARPTLPAPVKIPTIAPANTAVISGLTQTGIPAVALNAYRVAAARMATVEPSCGIDWALLAGIGREESDHGQFAGATLLADGTSTPPVVGPALDGVHWDYFAAAAQYEAVTGDRTYAHALGPMQFIPSTWAAYGVDADGDGNANIFDINDAALSAARYLCAAGGNLRTLAGQTAAVLAYNHSDQYLAQVLAIAAAYRAGYPVTGIPVVGNTSGALPPVKQTGSTPPVNPAAPTAAAAGSASKAKPTMSPTPSKSASSSAKPSTSTGTLNNEPDSPIIPTSSNAPAPASSSSSPVDYGPTDSPAAGGVSSDPTTTDPGPSDSSSDSGGVLPGGGAISSVVCSVLLPCAASSS